MDLRVYDTLSSVSDEAVRMARGGAAHGSAVVARAQAEGKGRRGHRWIGTADGLYLAVVMRPQVPMQHLLALTAVCGMGVLDGLREVGARNVALGWPNDLLIAERNAFVPGQEPIPPRLERFGNVVLDAGAGEGGVFAVAGVNLNLTQVPSLDEVTEPGDFEAMHPLTPGGLGSAGVLLSADDLAPIVQRGMVARVDAWANDVRARRAMAGPLAPVLSEYFDEVPLLGQRVRASYPDGRVAATGYLVAVDVWHRITVRTSDGGDVDFAPEQVSIRLLG